MLSATLRTLSEGSIMRKGFIAAVVAAMVLLAGCAGGTIGPITIPPVSAPDVLKEVEKAKQKAEEVRNKVAGVRQVIVVKSKKHDGTAYYLIAKNGGTYALQPDLDLNGDGKSSTKELYDSVKKGQQLVVWAVKHPTRDKYFIVIKVE